MQVKPYDTDAIDQMVKIVKRARFLEMDGEECLGLAQALARLLDLKGRIQQELSKPPPSPVKTRKRAPSKPKPGKSIIKPVPKKPTGDAPK